MNMFKSMQECLFPTPALSGNVQPWAKGLGGWGHTDKKTIAAAAASVGLYVPVEEGKVEGVIKAVFENMVTPANEDKKPEELMNKFVLNFLTEMESNESGLTVKQLRDKLEKEMYPLHGK